MSIKLNGATSGSVELDVPAAVTGGDVSLSLPGAGTVDRLERAGNILQIVQTVKTSRFTTTSGSATDITGFSASITPSSTSSKILIISSFHLGLGSAGAYARPQLLRGSTVIGLGDASGSSTRVTAANISADSADHEIANISYTYLDSPATTSATTYKWQVYTFSSRTVTFNGSEGTGDSNRLSTSSTITLIEVAA